jgi:sec-independent protein translocase protein TatA
MNFLPGPMELILILVIVAMLFGVGKLPEVFGAVGKGIKEFRKEATDGDSKASAAPVTETPAQTVAAPVDAVPVAVAPIAAAPANAQAIAVPPVAAAPIVTEVSTEKVEQA